MAVKLRAQLDPSGQAEHKRALPLHLAALPIHPSGSGAAGQQQRVLCVRACVCVRGEGTLFESKRKHVRVHEYRRLEFLICLPDFKRTRKFDGRAFPCKERREDSSQSSAEPPHRSV